MRPWGDRGRRVRARGGRGRGAASLLGVVNEVAPRTIRAEADGVEGAAQLSFVLGVSVQCSQLSAAVGKLALVAVFTEAVLLKGPAQLCLVPRGVAAALSWLRVTAVQATVL